MLLVGLYLMPFAGIAFIWFVVALRMWVEATARRRDILLSNMQLATGILYVALFFAGAASTSVLAASVEFSDGDIDPVVAHQFPQFGSTLLLVFALRMAAIFVFATSTIARKSTRRAQLVRVERLRGRSVPSTQRLVAAMAGADLSDLAARAQRHPAAPSHARCRRIC